MRASITSLWILLAIILVTLGGRFLRRVLIPAWVLNTRDEVRLNQDFGLGRLVLRVGRRIGRNGQICRSEEVDMSFRRFVILGKPAVLTAGFIVGYGKGNHRLYIVGGGNEWVGGTTGLGFGIEPGVSITS